MAPAPPARPAQCTEPQISQDTALSSHRIHYYIRAQVVVLKRRDALKREYTRTHKLAANANTFPGRPWRRGSRTCLAEVWAHALTQNSRGGGAPGAAFEHSTGNGNVASSLRLSDITQHLAPRLVHLVVIDRPLACRPRLPRRRLRRTKAGASTPRGDQAGRRRARGRRCAARGEVVVQMAAVARWRLLRGSGEATAEAAGVPG